MHMFMLYCFSHESFIFPPHPALLPPFSILTVLLLHVHHAGRHDGMVPGLATVGHPGSGCRCLAWMAFLCSGRVGDLNACLFVQRDVQQK